MSTKIVQEELLELVKLLYQEKMEDLKQYQNKLKHSSFSERRKNGICWYPVTVEKSSYSNTENLMLRISRPLNHKEPHSFQSGKLVSFFSNAYDNNEDEETVTGVVNMAKDREMLITLNANEEPDWVYDGKLGVQLLFDENSYREMEYGLKRLIKEPGDRLIELKEIILGERNAEFSDISIPELPELNAQQNKALKLAASARDIAIIHGPPGTGKTTTLVHCILNALKSETQVLVCAPSNAAVDLLVEKLGEYGVDVIRVGHPARVTKNILDSTLDAKIIGHKQYKELKSLRKQAEEYRNMGLKYKRNFGHSEREQRKLLLTEAKRLRQEANLLADYIKDDIIGRSRVIASTLIGANNMALKGMKFSTAFIDEAAQGLEPACWLPIIKADKVVFAGDHCQLPPTIKSFEAAKNGLEITLFEKAIKRNQADVMLTEQYRMNEQIMKFSSEQFYNGQLLANEKIKSHVIFPEDLPIEFIDTAGCGFYEQSNPESKSSLNPEEMHIAFKHLNAYLQTIHTLNLTDNISDIGIISPYKAQVSLMQESFALIPELDNEFANKVAINTIDSFQGQERDVIYISLVRSNEKGEIGFLKDVRRMNVAMTRARKKLVLVGDSSTIGNFPFYNSFLDYIYEINAYRSAFEFID